MARIGIYGGSFNPPHIGHVQAVHYACEALALSKMLIIPACISPNKDLPQDTPTAQQRLDMTALGFAQASGTCVLDLELRRGGVSYTADTIEEIRSQYPDDELVLLMGADVFLGFLDWYQPERILEHVSLAVFQRGDRENMKKLHDQKTLLEQLGTRVQLLENSIVPVSSTDIRRMLVFGCAQPYLPEGVFLYIQQNELYSVGKNHRDLSLEALEEAVVSLLKPNRVAHVLGCKTAAVALAKRWGADETDAARAALLHDITKALDGPAQLTLCSEYGIVLDDFSIKNTKTLHALTGSLVAERIFGESEAVVNAIRWHTTGKADMNLLEKIIYVADYMEPNRDFPGVERLRTLAQTDIDKALKLGLEMTIGVLQEQGREISPESRDALCYLEQTGV